MTVELAIAGFGCLALAAGHATAGLQVLPRLTKAGMSPTSFGSRAVTIGMLRFTWHVVTLVLLTFAGLLLSMTLATEWATQTLLLRWLALLWLVVAAMGVWMARRRLTNLIRLPVPVVAALIAVMCWRASM